MSDTPMFEHHPEAGLWVEPQFEWVDDIPVVSEGLSSSPPGPCPFCGGPFPPYVRHLCP